MRTAVLLMVTTFVYGLYGLGFLLIPHQMIALYGGEIGDIGEFTTRLYGSLLVGVAIICWFARDAQKDDSFHAILIGMFVATLLGGILAAINLSTSATVKNMSYLPMIIQFLLAASYGYAQFGPFKKSE
jgi:hypothetical protein